MTFEERERINEGDSGLFTALGTPSGTAWPAISHYYGNVVRQLFLGGAALMLFTAPLYASNIKLEFPYEVVGALLAVALGALTGPHQRLISFADAVVAGAGFLVYAVWGIFGYENSTSLAFVLRIAIAVVFLFAFYFSMKTVRAFQMHQIGKRETIDEFDESR